MNKISLSVADMSKNEIGTGPMLKPIRMTAKSACGDKQHDMQTLPVHLGSVSNRCPLLRVYEKRQLCSFARPSMNMMLRRMSGSSMKQKWPSRTPRIDDQPGRRGSVFTNGCLFGEKDQHFGISLDQRFQADLPRVK